MRGTYRFYEDGKLVGEAKNLITTEGKRAIVRYLAGYTKAYAGSIAVGVMDTAANVADTQLGFEFGRTNVTVISADLSAYNIVLKGTLDQSLVGTIYEAGLWSLITPDNIAGGRFISNFTSDETWSAGTFDSANTRTGGGGLRFNATASGSVTSTRTDIYVDLSNYRNTYPFYLAYYAADANCASIKLNLHTDASNYFSYTIASPTAGYRTQQFNKLACTQTGTPDWGNITSMDIVVTAKSAGATAVTLDGFRTEGDDYGTNDQILISHGILPTPITKTSLSRMDIEYELEFNL